jgi:hypothetical protein
MATLKQKHFTWLSLALLLVTYTWFGWYLSGLQAQPLWVKSACYRVFGEALQEPMREVSPPASPTSAQAEGPDQTTAPAIAPESDYSRTMCAAILKHNVPAGLLAVAWIIVTSIAFISPLTSFSAFITRFFQSDTVAMMTLFMAAGLAAVILYWLHIFLQILTILAVDTLARIDIQYAGLTGIQAFWILTLVSLAGLILGWTANALI